MITYRYPKYSCIGWHALVYAGMRWYAVVCVGMRLLVLPVRLGSGIIPKRHEKTRKGGIDDI